MLTYTLYAKITNMERVVKCNGCEKYFMHTEKDLNCPFCHIKYVEAAKKETKDKKWTAKTPKESFKIWEN